MSDLRPPVGPPGQVGSGSAQPIKPVIHSHHDQESSALGLIGEGEASHSENKIKAIGLSGASLRKEQYKRAPNMTGSGSCRVRTFHGKLSSQGLEYMDNQINEWLDGHPQVEVKFVTSSVGVFEGKMREPALILNLWY